MYYLPERLYVAKGDGRGSLGFATPAPLGNSKTELAKFVKRKGTVDNWARGGKKSAEFIDNKPHSGFTFVDTARRYTTSNVVFRVKDTEFDYTVEISAENFMELIEQCVIDKGVVQGDLVWVRSGANNRLVVGGSDNHKAAEKETKSRMNVSEGKAKALRGNIPYGSTVLLQNGKEVVWLDKMNMLQTVVSEGDSDGNDDGKVVYSNKGTERCFIHEDKFCYLGSTLKPTKIVKEADKTSESVCDMFVHDFNVKRSVVNVGCGHDNSVCNTFGISEYNTNNGIVKMNMTKEDNYNDYNYCDIIQPRDKTIEELEAGLSTVEVSCKSSNNRYHDIEYISLQVGNMLLNVQHVDSVNDYHNSNYPHVDTKLKELHLNDVHQDYNRSRFGSSRYIYQPTTVLQTTDDGLYIKKLVAVELVALLKGKLRDVGSVLGAAVYNHTGLDSNVIELTDYVTTTPTDNIATYITNKLYNSEAK